MPAPSSPRRYEFHPEAEKDFLGALRFYRDHGSGKIAQDFEAELRRCAASSPIAPAVLPKGVRRLVLDTFPFNLHYVVGSEAIRILAVAHQSRRPGYWFNRL